MVTDIPPSEPPIVPPPAPGGAEPSPASAPIKPSDNKITFKMILKILLQKLMEFLLNLAPAQKKGSIHPAEIVRDVPNNASVEEFIKWLKMLQEQNDVHHGEDYTSGAMQVPGSSNNPVSPNKPATTFSYTNKHLKMIMVLARGPVQQDLSLLLLILATNQIMMSRQKGCLTFLIKTLD